MLSWLWLTFDLRVLILYSQISISFPTQLPDRYTFSLDPLFAPVDPAKSSSRVLSTKIEVVLKKAIPGQKWHALESSNLTPLAETSATVLTDSELAKSTVLASQTPDSGPSYPTSSRTGPKNWDKLADDLTKKPKKKRDEDKNSGDDDEGADEYEEEGGDPVNAFFQKLYAGADPDTRRAMMKSYQESSGTALSTNWAEVSKGKVETTPPDGMEAKTWNQ